MHRQWHSLASQDLNVGWLIRNTGVETSVIIKRTASLIAHRNCPFIRVRALSYGSEIPRFLRQKEFGEV